MDPAPVNKTFSVFVQHPASVNYNLVAPELFTFKPNPEIAEVYPLSSIVQ